MIINNTFHFIFVHVPKSAGTSLAHHLSKLSCYCDLEIGGTELGEAIQPEFSRRHGLSKHSTAMEIHAVTGDVFWKRYFTFGFVRNPYERSFSIFNFMRKMSAQKILPYVEIDQFSTFQEFILSDYYQAEGPDRILCPQFFWLRRNFSSEELSVDYVGRVEEIEQNINEIALRVGQGMQKHEWFDLPQFNRSDCSKRTVWDELNERPELKEIIYLKNEVDFRLFGYER